MKIIKFSLLSFLLLTLLIFSCDKPKEDQNKAIENLGLPNNSNDIIITKTQFKESELKLDSMSKLPFPKMIMASGMLDVPPQNRAVISTFAGGYVKNTHLLVGDRVKKGQALITIENLEFVQIQQDYLEIVEQLSYLKSEYERQKTLYDEKISSQKSYLKADSEYKRAMAFYSGLRKKLKMLNINPVNVEKGEMTSVITLFSPINGSITKIMANIGVFISPADVIMEIVNTDHIHLELNVFEKDAMKIKVGEPIIFKIPEASSEVFAAEVHLVGTSIDEQSRTIKVHGHLKNEIDNKFATGMFVDAQIVIENPYVKALPEESIVSLTNTNYILQLKSKKGDQYSFSKKEVKVGETYKGYTEIININDFNPTDQFLVKGSFNLIVDE